VFEEQEAQQWFKPQIQRADDEYRKRLLHPSDLPVEERLLHYGKTVAESRRQLREDREALEKKQLLEFFRPPESQNKKSQTSFVTRAATKKNDRDKHIGEIRAQQARENTFQPSISRLSQQLAQEQRRAQGQPNRIVALHEEAEQRRREKEKRVREHAALEADRRVYHPTTNPQSEQWIRRGQHGTFFQKDFVDRQEDYARIHDEHAIALQETKAEEQRLALEASRATSTLARVRHEMIEQQVERLYYEGPEVSKEVKQRLAQQLKRKSARSLQHFRLGQSTWRGKFLALEADRRVYHPTTNPQSEQWIRRGQHGTFFQKDFVDRQEDYARIHDEHAIALQETKAEEQRRALEASRATSTLARVRHEMIEQQVERLYYEGPEVSKEVKQRLAQQLEKEECPFAPTLSIGSEYVARKIPRNTNVVERLFNVPKRSYSARDDPKMSSRHNDSSLLSGSQNGGGRTVGSADANAFYRRQVDSVQRTQDQLALKHSEQQLEKQLECTFRPRTNSRPSTPQKQQSSAVAARASSTPPPPSPQVSGMSEFLKRKELAKKLAEDKIARIEALGKGKPCNGPNFTVVTPFKLSNRKPVIRSSSNADNNHRYETVVGSPSAKDRWHVHHHEASAAQHQQKPLHSQMNTSTGSLNNSRRAATLHDDRIPRAGFLDPYNSEKLLQAIRRHATSSNNNHY
ncbi:Hypothetical protein, putative, partial [Bodo saltans]